MEIQNSTSRGGTSDPQTKTQRPASPVSSCVSMTSDKSIDFPPAFSSDPVLPDPGLEYAEIIRLKTGPRKYFCNLTLNPNTAHRYLSLSEKNRVVRWSETEQRYSDHPERFDCRPQVLCEESVCGRCYWEVEWNRERWGWMYISVSYKEISRKGVGYECAFGRNNQSWSLFCSSTLSFWHNNIETKILEPPSSRIGVYVDHSAGTLSFYRVSDAMTLLHRVHTTFTQPLYAGFGVYDYGSALRLCDPE